VTLDEGLRRADPAELVAAARRRTRALLPARADLVAMGRQPRRDIVAGLTVAVVALPLALGFGVTSGLGADAGLATAIVAGILAAVLGGSNVQVSGPTGAMTVVLLPIIATFGAPGVLVVGLMAGLILLGLAYAGAGRTMRYVPLPVIEGFTVGIAVIIALGQLPAALGVAATGETVLALDADALSAWLADPGLAAPAITLGIAGAILLGVRFRPGIPVSLAAVAAATAVVALVGVPVPTIGEIAAGLRAPTIPVVDLRALTSLVLPAVAVAALAALESLLSATVADGMRVGERHDSDRELFGQGVANLVVPLFGGMPATAAVARTAVNVRSGARSRLAAVIQSGALLVVVLAAAPLVGMIPLAALAGVLIATAVQMVEVSSLAALLRSTRGDAAVLVVTAGATIVLDLVTAVILGFMVAGVHALREVARSARLDEIQLDPGDHADEERALLDEHIVAYRLDGPLFFGAAHAFLLELSEVSDVRVVVLRLSRLATLDATGASVLADTIRRLEGRGVTVLLSGVRARHESLLRRLGVFEELAHERHLFDTTPDAIAHARLHAARVTHGSTGGEPPSAGERGAATA
jgi:MFS superfamily sulfate permease-like transporter